MGQSDNLCSVIAAIYDTSNVHQRPHGNQCSRNRDDTAWFSCSSREISGMWLRWSLITLYLMQLLVLSSMVAAYIYSNIARTTTTHEPQQNVSQLATVESTANAQRTGEDHFNTHIELKSVSLFHIKKSLGNLTSPVDLARLFIGSKVSDVELSHWLEEKHSRHVTSGGQPVSVDAVDHYQTSGDHGDDNATEGDHVVGMKSMDYQNDEPSSYDIEVFSAAVHHAKAGENQDLYPCRFPMPFVHLVKDPTQPTRYFLPECVLLHRCMNHTGCCKSSMLECAPRKVERVKMAFLVFNIDGVQEHMVGYDTEDAILLTFENHTECECRPKVRANLCTRKCPAPFKLTREGSECTCQCFPKGHMDEEGRLCERIKHGFRELSHDGLVCIKDNNCYQPSCEVGHFNLLTGLCPLSDEYALPRFLFNSSQQQRQYRGHINGFETVPTYKTSLQPRTRRMTTRATTEPTTSTSSTPETTTRGTTPRAESLKMSATSQRPGKNAPPRQRLQGQFSSHSFHENQNRRNRNRKKVRVRDKSPKSTTSRVGSTTAPSTKPTSLVNESTVPLTETAASQSPTSISESTTLIAEPRKSNTETTKTPNELMAQTTTSPPLTEIDRIATTETASPSMADMSSPKLVEYDSAMATHRVKETFQSDMPAQPGQRSSSFSSDGVNKRSLSPRRNVHYADSERRHSLRDEEMTAGHIESKRSSHFEARSSDSEYSESSWTEDYFEGSGDYPDQ